MKSLTHNSRAFTLVELLTVIAVLAVLTAIAIPVIGSALARSRLTQCTSNLRQWGIGYQLYASEHRGRFPQADEVSGDSSTQWQELIAPYVLGGGPSSDSANLRGVMRAKFQCPGNDAGGIVYGDNLYLSPSKYAKAPRLMIALEQPPASFMLMAENYTGGLWDTREWTGSSGVDYTRHSSGGVGVANFLFADFHVETLSHQQTLDRPVITKP